MVELEKKKDPFDKKERFSIRLEVPLPKSKGIQEKEVFLTANPQNIQYVGKEKEEAKEDFKFFFKADRLDMENFLRNIFDTEGVGIEPLREGSRPMFLSDSPACFHLKTLFQYGITGYFMHDGMKWSIKVPDEIRRELLKKLKER